ncbi:hypothetical protein LDENG_00262090 [Lucifuga dentata]|nr:hypothetical protein LDENG_00262090 [Lucifuga dentata]
MASEQESSNGPGKKSMREKAIERRNINKEHNSNFKAGYVPIEEERLHKTGLRGRKGNMAVCIIVLLFLLALINLIITLVIWTVIRIGPNGCDSMEFHETGLLRFKQKADMGIVHPLHKSTVGGRKDRDLVIVGNNNPVVFQQGTTKLSVEKDKTSIVSDVGISFTDPRTQTTFFSTDFENHEFHLPKGVKVLSVKKASTERITSSASSDLNIKGDSKAIIRGNEGINIMGRTVEFKVGGGIELRAENSIVLNGSVMFNATRIPNSAGDVYFDEGLERVEVDKVNALWFGEKRVTTFPFSLLQSGYLSVSILFGLCEVFSLIYDPSAVPGRGVMAVTQGSFLVAALLLLLLLLLSHGLHSFPSLPDCPAFCTCQRTSLINCSSSGLSLVPHPLQDTVADLDLSHNLLSSVNLRQPHKRLRNVWLGNNSITRLSLCIERAMGRQNVRGRHPHRSRAWSRQGCVSWAPALQLLSVERNQLDELPEGLGGSESLQVLQLSFNRISTLEPGDLSHLRQLKELHLQQNLITTLHPEAFRDLTQLRVLDLSFNLLTSLHPVTYLSLRNIGVIVKLSGNRWHCDCSMHSLRRRMAYDSNRGLQDWSVVCTSPSTLSGRDLLQLAEDDLNCFNTENKSGQHQDVTVYRGSEILLSCSTQESMWWTPNGQVSVSEPQAGLLISEITERDTGLYVCVSESKQEVGVVSVFHLQIRKVEGAKRKTRSLPRSSQLIIPQNTPIKNSQERNQGATQSNLALAVTLSVFITFLVAFILGVLARPFIDILWRRVVNKKNNSAANSVSSAGQRQYDNEAYSSADEPEERGPHRERRVTFSTIDFSEQTNVQYYDTVASGNEVIINENAVIECKGVEASCQSEDSTADSVTDNRIQLSSDNNHRNSTDLSGVLDPGPTHTMEFEHIPDPAELEERTSLSSRSDSSLSVKVQKENHLTQEDHSNPQSPQLAEDPLQKRANSSVDISAVTQAEVPQTSSNIRSEIPEFSSEPFADWSHINNTSSTDSDLWQENEEKFDFSDSLSPSAGPSSLFGSFNDSNLCMVPPSDRWKRSERSNSSSSSYVSGDEPTNYTVNPEPEEEGNIQMITNEPIKPSPGFNQDYYYRHDIQRPGMRPEYSDSSQSSDSDEDPMCCTDEKGTDEGLDRKNYIHKSEHSIPSVTSGETTYYIQEEQEQGKRHSPSHESFSSSDERDRTDKGITNDKPGGIPLIKRHLDVKAPSPNSSSSESEDEKIEHKHKIQLEPPVISKPTEDRFIGSPTLINNSHTPKASHNIKLEKYTIITDELGNKSKAENISPAPQVNPQWAMLNLGISRFRKRLDITLDTDTPPSVPLSSPPDSPSSSSSNKSMDEEKHSKYRQNKGADKMQGIIVTSASNSGDYGIERKNGVELKSQTSKVEEESEPVWPHQSLSNIPHIKRTLDIKAPSQIESFSSKISKNDTIDHALQAQGVSVDIGVTSHKRDIKFSDRSLAVPYIKRYLNIKAPSSQPINSPVSFIESENKMTGYTAKHNKHQSHLSPNDSSPSSSEDERTDYIKQRHKDAEKLTLTQEYSLHKVGLNTPPASGRDPSTTFDDVVRRKIEQSRQTSDLDLLSEIRWAGIGHHLSEFPTSSPRRHLNVGSKEKIVSTPMSEDRKIKGLKALKAMASERRKWDREDEDLSKGRSALWGDDSPPFVPRSSEQDSKPLAKQSLPELLLSSSHHRRHVVGDVHPPQEAPPPPPPPPDAPPPEEEAAIPIWRSSEQ